MVNTRKKRRLLRRESESLSGKTMDGAKKKFIEGKYEESLAMYERFTEESSEKHQNNSVFFELLLGKSLVLAHLSRFEDAIQCYEKAATIQPITKPYISDFIENVLNLLRKITEKNGTTSRAVSPRILSCPLCRGILTDPTTLACGHSICLSCVPKLDKKTCDVCSKAINLYGVKVNVTLQQIIWKYCKSEFDASRLRLNGNNLLKDGKRSQAMEKYQKALQLDPKDPPLNSNLALLITQEGRFEKALEYANVVCNQAPKWPKGFYRKGSALIGLKLKPEAALALVQCASLDPKNDAVKKLLTEVVEEMFSEVSNSTESEAKLTMLATFMDLLEKFIKSENTNESDASNEDEAKLPKEYDGQDFECTLCCRLFYEPVTTPCGHVFCQSCLNRSLDHRPDCPICRGSLTQVLALRNQNVTEAIEKLMQKHLADEYEERKKVHIEEMEKLASVANNTEEDIPIFVCTLAFPTLPCPLHIFEPRYRLMVRQCMESGSKQFGMCTYDEETGFAEYGTMLVILDVEFLPDGRSLVNTIGGRRFKVLSKGTRDGYSVAKVEWITDEKMVVEEEEAELKTLLREVFDKAKGWFDMLPLLLRRRIVNSVSEMPHWHEDADKLPHGPEWLWWLISVCPLDPKAQLAMLGLTSLKQRLLAMRRILAAIS